VCRKANIDLTKRAGELSEEEVKQHEITHRNCNPPKYVIFSTGCDGSNNT